jgi:hypothetical protein
MPVLSVWLGMLFEGLPNEADSVIAVRCVHLCPGAALDGMLDGAADARQCARHRPPDLYHDHIPMTHTGVEISRFAPAIVLAVKYFFQNALKRLELCDIK